MIWYEGIMIITLSERSISAAPWSRCRAGVGEEVQATGYQGKLSVEK